MPGDLRFQDGTPLYLQVSRHLHRLIADGTYPLGTLLPPEAELAADLRVSRHTIRQAIALLRRRGLLSVRKGVGTRVAATDDDWRGRFTASSRGELFDFARASEFHVTDRTTIEARGRLAGEMGIRPGRRLYRIAGPRFLAGETTPFSYNEVYLDPRLETVVSRIDVLREAIFTLVETHAGDRVEEIRQEVRALHMPVVAAHCLGRAPGDLCLRMTRRFNGSGGRLLEYAVQYHPGDTFSYQTTLSST